MLREKEYDVIADTTSAIWRQVSTFQKGPVLSTFDVEAFGLDSAAVVDVTDLFLSNIPELSPGWRISMPWPRAPWAAPAMA